MTENTLRVLGALSFEEQDALGRWLGTACNRAGITDKRARLHLQAELHALFGPGRGDDRQR